jgi:hypothetical protein
MWRGAVASAIRGKRGQAFLKEMLNALDAMPEHKLIANDLENEGAVCALGAVGKARGADMANIDPYDSVTVASLFGVSDALVREIAFVNDEYTCTNETPEQRYSMMREWVQKQIRAA